MMKRAASIEEKADILAVIEADIRSYLSRDRAAWRENWVRDARMTSIMECGTLQVARGFAAFEANVFAAMDTSPAPTAPNINRENIAIHISGESAWAVFDQTVGDTDDPLAPPDFSHNFRLLERDNGRWKIVFHGVWSPPMPAVERPSIEVDAHGHVKQMNRLAEDRSLSSFGLAVSAGRLRAAYPGWDAQLQKTIERAGALTNYAQFNKANARTGKPLVYPVVLGEDDSGSVLLCFVRIVDARIFVAFGNSPKLTEQIKLAGMIYGLSAAQMTLAGHIADGADLAGAAAAMKVSLNTARTHLRRMFDKTEVRSQIDLLRLFLSLDK